MKVCGYRTGLLTCIIVVFVCTIVVINQTGLWWKKLRLNILQRPNSATEIAFGESIPPSQSSNLFLEHGLPVIYLITPTYKRLAQKADLTRMSHTLKLVKKVHWIVIEDSETKTKLVEDFLKNSGIPYTHLNASSSAKAARNPSGTLKQRGLIQRNEGLSWLRKYQFAIDNGGVVFFADDDNTYSLRLFDEMRYTKKVSVWPVGLSGGLPYETPVVHNGKVVGWFAWEPRRRFATDMCGFGINLHLVLYQRPTAVFTYTHKPGYLENNILVDLGVTLDDLEPKAKNCTEVLVWHTRTAKPEVIPKNVHTRFYIHKNVTGMDHNDLIERYTSNSHFEV